MSNRNKYIAAAAVIGPTLIFLVLWQWTGFLNLLRPIGQFAHIPIPEHVGSPLGTLNFGTINRPMTVLFMGTDVVYEAARRGQNVKADHVALNGRSDTMMLVFLNPAKGKISVLNIPRDTEAFIGRWGIQKINSANALGGPEMARATVTGLLNVPIDHYVVMNLQGLVDLVNELGGVTVEVPKKMSYMDWTAKLKIDLEPGVHTLTGNQSMGFVRFRHDDLGDIGRVQRQQIFLQAAMRRMLDPRSWPHVPALVKIAKNSINTDMSDMEIFQCINFAHGVPKSAYKFVMLPGQFSGNGDWVATTDARTLAMRLADPDQETVVSRRNLSVCVINTTRDPLMGSKVAKALRELGYVTSVGKDQPEVPFKHTRIIAQFGNTADAEMLKADLGGGGEVVNASVGNLNTSLTVYARDDLQLDKITMSSVDAPYVPSTGMPQPLVVNPQADHPRRPSLGDAPPPIDTTAAAPPPAETSPAENTGESLGGESEQNTPAQNPGSRGEEGSGTGSGAPQPGNEAAEREHERFLHPFRNAQPTEKVEKPAVEAAPESGASRQEFPTRSGSSSEGLGPSN